MHPQEEQSLRGHQVSAVKLMNRRLTFEVTLDSLRGDGFRKNNCPSLDGPADEDLGGGFAEGFRGFDHKGVVDGSRRLLELLKFLGVDCIRT